MITTETKKKQTNKQTSKKQATKTVYATMYMYSSNSRQWKKFDKVT